VGSASHFLFFASAPVGNWYVKTNHNMNPNKKTIGGALRQVMPLETYIGIQEGISEGLTDSRKMLAELMARNSQNEVIWAYKLEEAQKQGKNTQHITLELKGMMHIHREKEALANEVLDILTNLKTKLSELFEEKASKFRHGLAIRSALKRIKKNIEKI